MKWQIESMATVEVEKYLEVIKPELERRRLVAQSFISDEKTPEHDKVLKEMNKRIKDALFL